MQLLIVEFECEYNTPLPNLSHNSHSNWTTVLQEANQDNRNYICASYPFNHHKHLLQVSTETKICHGNCTTLTMICVQHNSISLPCRKRDSMTYHHIYCCFQAITRIYSIHKTSIMLLIFLISKTNVSQPSDNILYTLICINFELQTTKEKLIKPKP